MFVPSLRAQSHIADLAFGTDERGRHFKQGKGQEPLKLIMKLVKMIVNKLNKIDKLCSTQLRYAKILRKMQKTQCKNVKHMVTPAKKCCSINKLKFSYIERVDVLMTLVSVRLVPAVPVL